LTLTQPWCGLVASGIKLVENRDRSIIKREDFGRPFALHASREIEPAVYDRIFEIAPDLLGRASLDEDAGEAQFRLGPDHAAPWYRLSRITSAVIAVATIDRAVVLTADDRVLDLASYEDIVVDLGDQRRWLFGPIGYVLRNVQALATPVPCRGWQGFWNLTSRGERERGVWSEVEREVSAQISLAAGR
jgi:hypothetical protein